MAYANTLQEMLDGDGEFDSLSADSNHIWLILCVTALGGKAGFIRKADYTVLCRQSKRSLEVVEAAIEDFKRLGFVHEDGEYIWIRSRIKHRCNSGNWKAGAIREAEDFAEKSERLSDMCLAKYTLKRKPAPESPPIIQTDRHKTVPDLRPVGTGPPGRMPKLTDNGIPPLTEDEIAAIAAEVQDDVQR